MTVIFSSHLSRTFTNWWNLYRASGGNNGFITWDYERLDRILPGRVRSVEEWMRKIGYDGSGTLVLKTFHDMRSKA